MESPIDAYIAQFPPGVQEGCRRSAPYPRSRAGCRRKSATGCPVLSARQLCISRRSKAISLFPGPSASGLRAPAGGLQNVKGTIQFPYDKPLPLELVNRCCYRADETAATEARKKRKK